MAERYLTHEEFQLWARSETTYDRDLIIAAIGAAEQMIDNALGRRVEVAGSSTARTYVPARNTNHLSIHDCASVTTVTEDGTALTVDVDYVLRPLGARNVAGETVPYTTLVRLDKPWYRYGERATVSVTAAWGWPSTIPAPIIEACKILAKEYLEQRDVRHGLVGVSEAGGIGARRNVKVLDMIAQYSRNPHWLVA